MPPPKHPEIYHIVHHDRLASIIADGGLWSDARMLERQNAGTTIGISDIKHRRLNQLTLSSHPNLYVGQCVPFYFCPRSVMLYLIHKANHADLAYRGGQEAIIHLEADLKDAVAWADEKGRRWAFTRSNAGASDFKDYASVEDLIEINWHAVQARDWRNHKEGKQAEFLMEYDFPWHLIRQIGTCSTETKKHVMLALSQATHQPRIEIRPDWYY